MFTDTSSGTASRATFSSRRRLYEDVSDEKTYPLQDAAVAIPCKG